MTGPLNDEEKNILLKLARNSIENAVSGKRLALVDLEQYSPALVEEGASFVTLTKDGRLRGCIGALEAYQPLVQDVCDHAAAAALEDYRFSPVLPSEVPYLRIEISRLTPPVPLDYQDPIDLLKRLRPGVDGVIIRDAGRRATFLPQVWEQLSTPSEFLAHLCQKMGAPLDLWKRKILQVSVYQVEEWHE